MRPVGLYVREVEGGHIYFLFYASPRIYTLASKDGEARIPDVKS